MERDVLPLSSPVGGQKDVASEKPSQQVRLMTDSFLEGSWVPLERPLFRDPNTASGYNIVASRI